jgi:hypothetical protein
MTTYGDRVTDVSMWSYATPPNRHKIQYSSTYDMAAIAA